MSRCRRFLLTLLMSLTWCADAAADDATQGRVCHFPPIPSAPANQFEPAKWPVTLGPDFYRSPGIVRASYDHFYLFIAYRALAGMPLGREAQERLAPFDPCWETTADAYDGYYRDGHPALTEAEALWKEQRVAAGAPALRKSPGHGWGYSCNPDAFRSAARTLLERLSAHGQGTAVQDWIAGQDAVFDSCAGGEPVPAPAPIPADAPAWLRQDRAYQLAAALMYQGKLAEASAAFDAIAVDAASPWHMSAPYMAARAQIRRSDGEGMGEAERRLLPLAQAATPSQLRTDARRLLQLAQLRTRPGEVLAALDARLNATPVPDTIGQDVRDYYVAYRDGGGAAANKLPFAAWLTAMRGGAPDGDVLQRWRATGQAQWLVAALATVTSDTAGLDALLTAAAKVDAGAPAYLSARYHLARLGADSVAALSIVDAALALPGLRIEDINAFKRIGMKRARSLDDVARFAARQSAMAAPGDQWRSLDTEGAALLNHGITLDMLAQLSANTSVPQQMRHEILTVAWTRALVLDRRDLVDALAPGIMAGYPQARAQVAALRKERSRVVRRGLGAVLLAQYPGMVGVLTDRQVLAGPANEILKSNPHISDATTDSRENWWCSFATDMPGYGWNAPDKEAADAAPVVPADWLSAAARARLTAERIALRGASNGADFLAPLVMDYARAHPTDPRLPDALANLIHAAGGCTRGDLTAAMFRHLHKYFPRSAPARRTRSHR